MDDRLGRRPARAKGKATASSSLAGRLVRLSVSLYLLCAIVYTSSSFFVAPAVRAVFGSTDAPTSPDAVNAASQVAKAPRSTNVPPKKGHNKGPGAHKHPALENAGVRAADIRLEDAADRVWAAAEAAEAAKKKGKKNAQFRPYVPPAVLDDSKSLVDMRLYGLQAAEWHTDLINWHAPSHPFARTKPVPDDLLPAQHSTPAAMSEDHFLSMTFASSLQPSKVIPYFYRASAPDEAGFNKEDIAIATLVTGNRFTVFQRLVERYQGPISATVHVIDSDQRSEQLQALHKMYTSSPSMQKYVDIHLVYDPYDRQFNMWRNVAKYFARTDYIMMLDVDFWICTDFRSRILNSEEIMNRLRTGLAAFVVPAFEFAKQSDGVDPSTFPSDKAGLLEIVNSGKIGMFHKSWAPGHGSTNYTRYYDAQPGEVYRVQSYTHSYEPYIVFKKEDTPWCDERFIGYGGNKAACLYELYLSGVSFYVLPDDFLIHQSHAYAEKARKHERKYNRKLYADFREELCFRYLNHFLDEMDSPRAKNLANECKKIRGFPTTAARFISAHAPK